MNLKPFSPPEVRPLLIPAGATSAVMPIVGRSVYFKEATYSNFSVSLNKGPFVPVDLAFGFRVPAYMEAFSTVQIKNDNAADLAVVMIVTELDVNDRRTNIIESRGGSAASMVPNAWQYLDLVPTSGVRLHIEANANRAAIVLKLGSADGPGRLDVYDAAVGGNLLASFYYSDESISPAIEKIANKGEFWIEDVVGNGNVAVSEWCFS